VLFFENDLFDFFCFCLTMVWLNFFVNILRSFVMKDSVSQMVVYNSSAVPFLENVTDDGKRIITVDAGVRFSVGILSRDKYVSQCILQINGLPTSKNLLCENVTTAVTPGVEEMLSAWNHNVCTSRFRFFFPGDKSDDFAHSIQCNYLDAYDKILHSLCMYVRPGVVKGFNPDIYNHVI
jgi:hypothetical protein